MALSFDPVQSRFILVGTVHYEKDSKNLQALPAVSNNLAAMKRILINQAIVGVPHKSIVTIEDPRDKADFSNRLVSAAKQADDLLFFYYAGHGLLGSQTKKFYLGTVASTEADADHDGFDFDEVRLLLSESRAKKRILILDCCFSGNAFDGVMGSADSFVDQTITIKSTYSIASAPPNRLSIAEPKSEYTAFTKELVQLLEGGTGGPEEYLTIDQIFNKLKERISLKPHLPMPRQRAELDGNKLVVARNRLGPSTIEAQISSLYRFILERANSIESQGKAFETKFNDLGEDVRSLCLKVNEFARTTTNDYLIPGGLNNAYDKLEDVIKECLSKSRATTDRCTYDNLGLTLQTSWSHVHRRLINPKFSRCEIRLYCLSPDFIRSSKGTILPLWLEEVNAKIEEIKRFVDNNATDLQSRDISLSLVSYSHFPAVHGFRINNADLLFSVIGWKSDNLVSEPIETYDFYQFVSASNTSDLAQLYHRLFKSWIDRANNTGDKILST